MKLLLKRYFRPKRHRLRRWLPVPTLRRMLGDRVRSAGVGEPILPMPDEPTLHLPKSAPAVIEPHETGIGILKPVELSHEEVLDVLDEFPKYYNGAVESLGETEVPDVAEVELCTSTHVPDGYRFEVECELRGDHDICSAIGGDITWPRETALAVAQ